MLFHMPDKVWCGLVVCSFHYFNIAEVVFRVSFVWALCEIITDRGYKSGTAAAGGLPPAVVAAAYSNLWLCLPDTCDNIGGNDIHLIQYILNANAPKSPQNELNCS